MAVCTVSLFNVKLQFPGNILKGHFFPTKTSCITTERRSYSLSCKNELFSSRNSQGYGYPHLRVSNGISKQGIIIRCCCLGSLVNAGDAISSGWVPLADHALLLASMMLTYIAGVIPDDKSLNSNQSIISPDNVVPGKSTLGSEISNDDGIYLQFAWDVVKSKLKDSLSTIEIGVEKSGDLSEFEQNSKRWPSSLCAIAEGPKLRLLWASFQLFYQKVNSIPEDYATSSTNDFSPVFAETIQKCCRNLCKSWLEEELRLKTQEPEEELPYLVVKELNVSENLIQNIRKSGKENLYVELTHALKFGSSRYGGYYTYSLFSQHGVAILEDLLITLADGVANMYLELISVDSSLSNEMNNIGLSLCTLSTRALQRLRNEVALHQWLHQNLEAVVSMYEDRFDLSTLQRKLVEEPNTNKAENFFWWKKFSFRGSQSIPSTLYFVVISQIQVPFKRTKELRALTGWKYYFSLFLELADIALPFVRKVVDKLKDAVSFFLVSLIGKSLGLIYSGIRQSLRWK